MAAHTNSEKLTTLRGRAGIVRACPPEVEPVGRVFSAHGKAQITAGERGKPAIRAELVLLDREIAERRLGIVGQPRLDGRRRAICGERIPHIE